ncbi:hypothetical protein B2G71_05080 [Novosphingobium sp. PC22D]|uniref:FecR family protein n=1 Tax=Novosphingobium sp. PC22D TaxID=1962403 RepID=UPI000BF18003|nr:FecR domain-containing protein [Novosphingobium sp. PC22D]PEQ13696.1 hypothetical protein B2G71_05080 [Novosphingobium sp. PC22D]
MTGASSDLMDAARAWMLRANDPAFTDWDGLTRWLEADPRHLPAYERALEEDAWAGELADAANRDAVHAPSESALPRRAARRRPWVALGGAVAAAVVGVTVWTMAPDAPASNVYVTALGEHRSIALSDGSRMEINGDSQVTYDPDTPRMVTLDRGEAVFEIRHDEANPFVVQAGKARLIDAGTVFNVVNDDGRFEVAVAEGAVIYDAGRQPVRLEPGDALVRMGRDGAIELRKADPANVGAWRDGLLQYDDATLTIVARDLSRTTGTPIAVSPVARDMHYSGTLAVEGPASDVFARIGPLLGVTFRKNGKGWEMTPRDGAIR